MNVAKWLLLAIVALPVAELIVFIAVAMAIGFGLAVLLVLAGSLAGGLLLRRVGGDHMARVRVAMNEGLGRTSFTALQADGPAAAMLLAGVLLLIPGFLTDVLAFLLPVPPLRRALAGRFAGQASKPGPDGVLELDREQWRRVPDPELPDHRNDAWKP
jgi:UPF0716 protein FxsA